MDAYIGFIILLNFTVDLLMLTAANRLCGGNETLRKGLPGAMLGGMFSGICFLPLPIWCLGTPARLVVLLVAALVTYGFCIRQISAFLLLMIGFGCITTGFLNVGWLELLVGFVCFCLLFMGRNEWKTDIVNMELSYGGKTKQIKALCDTGNGLRDPITGEAVIVLSPQLAYEFTGLTKQQLSCPTDAISLLPGARLIPYSTVGKDCGFLLAIRFSQVKVGRKSSSALVALAPSGFSMQGGFQALTGRAIL